MVSAMTVCPQCSSAQVVRNGFTHNGKQNHKCTACGRQFIENPQQGPIPQATKDMIGRLLLERIPLAGICRVTGVSDTWLQNYVNALYESVPKQAPAPKKKRGR